MTNYIELNENEKENLINDILGDVINPIFFIRKNYCGFFRYSTSGFQTDRRNFPGLYRLHHAYK